MIWHPRRISAETIEVRITAHAPDEGVSLPEPASVPAGDWHNIFELWVLNDRKLPMKVVRESWSPASDHYMLVEKIEVRKWPYGYAWGRYVRNGVGRRSSKRSDRPARTSGERWTESMGQSSALAWALGWAVLLSLVQAPAAAMSNAATYLIAEEIAAACEGSPGQIEPGAVIERDLTGDGRADLIISHEGISCSGAVSARSSFCGAQLCSVNIYIRRGTLLEPAAELLEAQVRVRDGAPPAIEMYGLGGTARTLQWNGQAFR